MRLPRWRCRCFFDRPVPPSKRADVEGRSAVSCNPTSLVWAPAGVAVIEGREELSVSCETKVQSLPTFMLFTAEKKQITSLAADFFSGQLLRCLGLLVVRPYDVNSPLANGSVVFLFSLTGSNFSRLGGVSANRSADFRLVSAPVFGKGAGGKSFAISLASQKCLVPGIFATSYNVTGRSSSGWAFMSAIVPTREADRRYEA